MRGEATIEFDEPFQISENGSFTSVKSVTLRAPGLGKRNVHFGMSSYVMSALSAMQQKRPDLMKQAEAEQSVLNVDDEDPVSAGAGNTKPAADEGDEALAFWQMMQMGLGEDKFPAFADYVMRTLTGSPKLATVGESETPFSDAAWESIAEANGMEAVDRICGTFVGFFMGAPKSKSANGKGTSASSSSRRKAASRSSTPQNSRSSN